MKTSQVEKVLSKAVEQCNHSGGRLTEKRKKILEVLIRSNTPLSAYEIADKFNKSAEQSMQPMSAYRILDFLVSEDLAHKLSSANKYVSCSHIACSHAHEVPQFLICRKCHKVKEIGIKKSIIEDLRDSVCSSGYTLMNTQLELDCLCEGCNDIAT